MGIVKRAKADNNGNKVNPVEWSGWKKFLILFLATGFGSGYFPVAPGTAGSVVGLAMAWALGNKSFFLILFLSVLLLGIGIYVSGAAGQIWKVSDPSRVVIDEIVGMLVTMIGIPVTGYYLCLGFLLFRLFDVWKPFPANLFEIKFEKGWGVMADDVMAGIYGNIVMHLVVRSQL